MLSRRRPVHHGLLALATSLLAVAALVPAAAEAQGRRFRGPDSSELGFATDAEIVIALREGEIIARRTLHIGTTGVQQLDIRYDGKMLRAIFHDVDVYERNFRLRDGSSFVRFYDRFAGQCAAYELSVILGLHMIPPAVLRRVGGEQGSVQLWVEGTMTEGDRNRRGLRPPDSRGWRRQQATMRVFDALIANSDRNTGNSLIDEDWNLWLIDHSRTFQIPRGKASYATVNQIPATFWDALRTLDEKATREQLRDFLEPAQLSALFKRHAELLAHINGLIETRGAGAVLIE